MFADLYIQKRTSYVGDKFRPCDKNRQVASAAVSDCPNNRNFMGTCLRKFSPRTIAHSGLSEMENCARGGDQIASGTIMIAPHGHSWAQSPHPLQKS